MKYKKKYSPKKHEEFEDVPTSETISCEHLLYFLEQGREVEFSYTEMEYFISHNLEGRALWTGKVKRSDYYDDQNEEFVNNVKIEGVTLADIFKQREAKIITIFQNIVFRLIYIIKSSYMFPLRKRFGMIVWE